MFRLEYNEPILSKEQRGACAAGMMLAAMFTLFSYNTIAQNLVPNPSFEIIDTCPQPPAVLGYQPGAKPMYWEPFSGSPDYLSGCAQNGQANAVPDNIFTHQEAFDGIAYSGMWTYFQLSDCCHEMIGAQLIQPLEIGTTYYVSLYANAAFGGSEWPFLASSNLGVLFRMEPDPLPLAPRLNFAHVYSQEIIDDTLGWTLISGSFEADSAYEYVILGNQFNNGQVIMDTLWNRDTIPGLYRGYTLVDQVCVSPDPSGCPMTSSILDIESNEVSIYPNPATDILNVTWKNISGYRIEIYDILGKRMLNEQVANSETFRANVKNWASSTYIVILHWKDSSRTFKFHKW